MKELTAVCREHGLILIEDCALSLLSQADGRPLGTYGDYAIFCLYKTLPVPNGGMLVQNTHILEDLTALDLRACGMASVTSRTAELLLEWTRMRANHLGSALLAVKRGLGSVLRVKRLPVGDIGFDPESVKTAMSGISARLLQRFDYDGIRRRRRENFLLMRHKLAGRATLLREDLADGVCPLFFPILVPDKRAAAQALRRHGIEAVELWNYGDAEAARQEFPDAHFLRDHVLELPIHQGISRAQVEYTADQVLRLNLHF
jgi:dTDP-4-amino-4,6-dideoxygalactose transaminase